MKIFGYFERKDPYGHYGNAPEVPTQPATEVTGTRCKHLDEEPASTNSETHNTLDEDVAVSVLQLAIVFITILLVLALMFLVSLCSGCSPKIIENTIVKHDTTYIQKLRHDSVYVKDSVFVHLWHEGDTVYVERDRWHTEWRDRIIHDSLYLSRRDTVRVTKTQEVAKPLSGWQWFQIWAGRLVLIALALAAAVVVVRRFFLPRH